MSGETNKLPRYARVIVNRGAEVEATIHEYMVGPLPTSDDTQIVPLTFCYNTGRNYIKNPLPEFENIVQWFTDLGNELSDLIGDLLGKVSIILNHLEECD